MGIDEYRKALDNKKISAAELTKEYLNRVHNDSCNCYITVCEQEALKAAEFAQKLIDSGKTRPLTGIPVAIKDNICTKGVRTTCASRILSEFVPFYDASVVELLKEQGAVILGKTNMDEFGMGGTSETSYFGSVKNPVDISKVPGGSSGGSAAAVKAGLCVASLGSDTGGSVRQPAAFCDVFGLKPTYGRVSRYGLIAFASSLDQIGILANSARDIGIMLEVISGKDERDMTGIAAPEIEYPMDLKGVKIGLPREFYDNCDDDVSKTVIAAAQRLKYFGAEFVECNIPSLKYAVPAYYAISSAEAFSNLARYDGVRYGYRSVGSATYNDVLEKSRSEGFGEVVRHRIQLGSSVLSDGRYNKALEMRRQIMSEYDAIFQKCDLMITPTSSVPAYSVDNVPDSPVSQNICTVTANLTGVPCMSVPCKGMGLSITADKFNEGLILAAADAYERSAGHEI